MDIFDDLEETLILLRDIAVEIPKRYKYNKEGIEHSDKEIQDLLHLMELVDLSASKGFQYYKELQEARQRRRAMKNENELIEPMLPVLNSLSQHKGKMDQGIGKVRDRKGVHEHRSYKARVRKDLEPMINGVKDVG